MKTCHIFCAAEFDGLLEPIEKDHVVIAADGGFLHTEALGISPDVILGDFDSLGYTPNLANVFPVEKDDTDTMLAVRRGLQMGCERFLIYGSVDGPRLDHTVANFQVLQYLADHGGYGYLVGRDYLITVLKNGKICFPASAKGILSIFCMGADAEGVDIQGLHYPLKDAVLTAGFPLAVSNHFDGVPGEITVKNGSLLILWDRENGLPERIKFQK